MAYPEEAIELAWTGFVGHQTQEQIVRTLRDAGWTQFSRSTLNEWIERFGWQERRSTADAKRRDRAGQAEDLAGEMLDDLIEVWRSLKAKVLDGRAKRDELWIYRDTGRLIIEMTKAQRPAGGGDSHPPQPLDGEAIAARVAEVLGA